jgi:hypothetical protein
MNLALLSGPLAPGHRLALLHLRGAVVAGLLALLLPRLAGRSANCATPSPRAGVLIVALGWRPRSGPISEPEISVGGSAIELGAGNTAPAVSIASDTPQPSLVAMALLHDPGPGSHGRSHGNESLPAVVLIWLAGVAFSPSA